MGGKRRWTRQYVYICVACLMIEACSLPASLGLSDREALQDRWDHLEPVQAQIGNRDFEAAVRVYQNALSGGEKYQYADLALFDMGLLHAHYDNPRKDYKKSLDCFNRLVREYPRSPLVEEAKIWAYLLDAIEKTKRIDIELEEKWKY